MSGVHLDAAHFSIKSVSDSIWNFQPSFFKKSSGKNERKAGRMRKNAAILVLFRQMLNDFCIKKRNKSNLGNEKKLYFFIFLMLFSLCNSNKVLHFCI
jgi:hypothetical protein